MRALTIGKRLNHSISSMGWTASVSGIAILLSLPLLVVIQYFFQPKTSTWSHLAHYVLTDYVVNSFLLAGGVAIGTLIIGVPSAWICATYKFPFKRTLELLLLLPLAVPAYVIAYTYTGLLDFSGPVQTFLRTRIGLEQIGTWFPEIRSLPSAVVMLSLVLYPYVHLLTRALLIDQCASLTDAAKTLGATTTQQFFRVLIPLARPAIVAGVSLALMETLADFGTVQYFGVDTFTTGIFRTWFGFGEIQTAAQLACILMLFVAALLYIEKRSRRRARYHNPSHGHRQYDFTELRGKHAAFAMVACFAPSLFGFIIPFALLSVWAAQTASNMMDAYFWQLAFNSVFLAACAALVTLAVAVLLAYGRRNHPNRYVQTLVGLSGMGYAVPGIVIAVGVLSLFGAFDHSLHALMNRLGVTGVGILLSGSLAAIIFAHAVRFLSIALQTVDSSLQKIHLSMDEAVRMLGGGRLQALRRVHIPLIRNGLLTAMLLVFVEVMKELPATLVLRPFNFNTLSIRTYELASDERLIDCSSSALTIVLCGIIPVALLNYSIQKRN